MADERSLLELSRAEGWQLLASVPVGRLVFTHQALPAIRPVNHLVDGDKIVVGLTPGSAIAASSGHRRNCCGYEADALDMTERLGWSVVVVGWRAWSRAMTRRRATGHGCGRGSAGPPRTSSRSARRS